MRNSTCGHGYALTCKVNALQIYFIYVLSPGMSVGGCKAASKSYGANECLFKNKKLKIENEKIKF